MPVVPKEKFTLLIGLACLPFLGACEPDRTPEAGPSEESAGVDDRIDHGGAQFSLTNCALFAGASADKTITTGIDGDCRFARNADESPQIYETDSGSYALIVASVPRETGKLCDTTVRAVRLDAADLRVSEEAQHILMCSSGPFDEAMIVTLSSSVPAD